MSSQRYDRVSTNDEDEVSTAPQVSQGPDSIPSSPPPSFRSRASSITSQHLLSEDPLISDADRTLADTFDDGTDSDNDREDHGDDRQRLMRGNPSQANEEQNNSTTATQTVVPGVTGAPGSTPPILINPNRVQNTTTVNRLSSANDGVFANLNAKPERGEKTEEQPPTYEQAAADATPPYWETTILAPGFASGDEVYFDGLPVGSIFSFVWNAMISMSFTLVGFLLTYLLHTTHAAKNGSRAGLGVTLVQYGFFMRSSGSSQPIPTPSTDPWSLPPDPNSPDFDSSKLADAAAVAVAQAQAEAEASQSSSGGGLSSVASSEWLAYALMIVGWFILIRSVSDFFKARRHEQLVLAAPDRGLNVPILAENETAETAA